VLESKDYGFVVVTVDGDVALIELNDPEHLNPEDPKTTEADLSYALWDIDRDREIRAAVLTGRGRAFSAGAYLGPPRAPRDARDDGRTPDERIAWGYSFGDFWKNLTGFHKPLIAAVNGYALGGGWKLAFACDMIIAGESAKLGSREIVVGRHPSPLTSQYMPKMLGKHRAFEAFLFCHVFSASEALELGLVNRVVPDDQTVATAMEVAHEIAKLPAVAVAFTKQAMNRAFGLTDTYDFERLEATYLGNVAESQEAMARVRSSRGGGS
jgi:enoyl-CoA hydratase/carnithine racemase